MLITLVIIGVVAALTLPTLMTKYQQHVFENQFKKSLYTISQIVASTRSELGVSRLVRYCAEYNVNSGGYYNANECGDAINKQLRRTSTKKQNRIHDGGLTDTERHDTIKTYNDKNNFTRLDSNLSSLFFVNQLSDGSFLGFNISRGHLYFGVDLNGYKKPNRLGYDIFYFIISKNDTLATPVESRSSYKNIAICNLTDTTSHNGVGCSYYALRNKCPYDDTKTYWECLK